MRVALAACLEVFMFLKLANSSTQVLVLCSVVLLRCKCVGAANIISCEPQKKSNTGGASLSDQKFQPRFPFLERCKYSTTMGATLSKTLLTCHLLYEDEVGG